jgi:hypothetical protein
MQRPATIRNEPKWIKYCTKIRARALDLIDGKMSLIDAASILWTLDIATHAQADTDLRLGGLRYTPCTIVIYA